MKDIRFSDLDLVLKSWDEARFGNKNFDHEFAMNCVGRMFEIQPSAKEVFGYKENDQVSRERAGMHGKLFASVFDSIFQMLGPDTEFMEEILYQVGTRHKVMGIRPEFFPFMGEALLYAIEMALERRLTRMEVNAWKEVYGAISSEIIKHILS
ncbi:hypothetical protein ACA910_003949 [Epithemia clementina (nom. ined.)]